MVLVEVSKTRAWLRRTAARPHPNTTILAERIVISQPHCLREPYPYSCRSLLVAIMFLGCLLLWSGGEARGQVNLNQGSLSNRMGDVQIHSGDRRIVLLTVLNETKARLDRQSVVKVHDLKTDVTVWQTTSKESEAALYDLDFGDYDVEVSAVGYLTAHTKLHIIGTIETQRLDVILQRDPMAVDLNASDDAFSGSARKDAKHAIYALKSGNLKDAEQRLDKLDKVVPSNAQVNFLLGYLFVQRGDFQKAEAYLSRAATLDPRRVQTLTLLGRVQLQREHDEDAQKTLEQAVATNGADSWEAHNLLADAYLRQKQYEKAREEAQRAIDRGKGAASVAQLVLGQALANVGRDQEGIQALKNFLATNPASPTAPAVRALISEIEDRDSGQTAASDKQSATDLLLSASRPSLPASVWGPPGIDEVKPFVAAGVACPYERIMDSSGKRVKELVNDVARFAATEDLLHEQLDQFGNPITKETRKFDYVASISEVRPGFLSVDEYRNERYGLYDLPDHIVTSGFVTLALIFHPDMRDNFQMTCEGLGEWQGQATWLIHFRQRDDKPSRIQNYTFGAEAYPVKLKGRAWITADKFQIVRMESELVSPVPQLSVEHQIVEYGAIHFNKQNVDLWLPKSVDLYLEFNRHRYHRRHSFDHYMLFSVNSEPGAQMTKKSAPGETSE
jgi:tetratricopeptide (TPR) repeat protein